MPNILQKLSRLNIDRARGAAPHKPLLLLCLLEIAEQGALQEFMPVTGVLTFNFIEYWSVVAHRRSQRPDIKLPLYHMKSDGLWLPLDAEQNTLRHREMPTFIHFAEEFLCLANDPELRNQARAVLIRTYFEPAEQVALLTMTGLDPAALELDLALVADAAGEAERGREGRFRIDVVMAYNYTCALTGYRLITLNAGTIVDACHIHPFAKSRNNDLNNGISLTKNAHWLFDCGLWSLTDDYTVIVADRHFSEAGEAVHLLTAMMGRQVRLPALRELWPNVRHLQWHRTHKFLGA
jgi:putative restriction endonuclease